MFLRQAFASILHLFVILAFFIGGLFFVFLPFLPHLRESFYEKSSLIGASLLLTALILLVGFYVLERGRYLVIKMGAAADIHLVRQAVEECFLRCFPKKIFLHELQLGSKSRIEIKVSFSPLDKEAREKLFLQVEKQLALLLRKQFCYSKPFYLIVNSDS